MDHDNGISNRELEQRLDAPDRGQHKAYSGMRNEKGGRGESRNNKKKRIKQTSAIVIDLCIAALILASFYLVNYGLPSSIQGKPLAERASAKASMPAGTDSAGKTGGNLATAAPEQTAAPSPKPTVDPTPWRVKFADKFTSGAVQQTDLSYQDANVNIRIENVQTDGLAYFFADIYLADIQYFRTAFAKRADVMGDREPAVDVAQENHAILAINGDHCVDNNGPVIRNGKLYRDETFADALVLYQDGSMETLSAEQLDMSAEEAAGAWQIWTFGPMLLKDGQPMREFNSTLNKANPRTAVGYYEPGHYCFLVVDGRQANYSEGMTLKQLSQFFYEKGCKVAFNLDGGRSSEMVFLGKTINRPYDGGRATTDILMIVEE